MGNSRIGVSKSMYCPLLGCSLFQTRFATSILAKLNKLDIQTNERLFTMARKRELYLNREQFFFDKISHKIALIQVIYYHTL